MAPPDNVQDRLTLRQWAYVGGILLAVAIGVSVHDAWSHSIRNDFTNYSLAASRVAYAGDNPYSKEETKSNYKYFPLNAALLGPLTLVSIPIAQGLWTALNVGLLLWCFRLHWAAARPRAVPVWVWIVTLGLASRFIAQNLKLGQWNTSVYCLSFAGLVIARKRPWAGGLALGLAAALKYMPGFFLLYFVARRQWKALLATSLAIAFWILIAPGALLGPARNLELIQSYRTKAKDTYGDMTSAQSVVGHSLRATLFAFLTPAAKSDEDTKAFVNILNLPPETARILVVSLMCVLLAGVIALSAWKRTGRSADAPIQWLLEVGIWHLALLMVSPEVRKAHLITIFTPAFALAMIALGGDFGRGTRKIAAWALGLACLCVVACSHSTAGATVSRIATLYGGYTLILIILFAASVYLLMTDKKRFAMGREQEDAESHLPARMAADTSVSTVADSPL